MQKKVWITISVLAVVALGVGFFFKDTLVKDYNDFGKNVQKNVAQFQKSDLGNTIAQVTNQILAPTPLHIGGQANNVILVKAKVISETNRQRFENGGLAALTENAKLDAAAQAKANDMFKNQYFEHISPSGDDPGTLVKRQGYGYIVSGENLILGNFKDEVEVVQDWMNSPGHRANILNNRYVDIGVAMVKGTYNGQTVWIGVQEFGLPLSACPEPSLSLKAEIEKDKAILDDLSLQIDAKRQQINSTSQRSKEYNTRVDEYNALVARYNQLNQVTKNIIATYNTEVNNFNSCVAGK